MSNVKIEGQRFELGEFSQTSGVAAAFSGEILSRHLERHARGDWGELEPEDRDANERAIEMGDRIMSAFVVDGVGRLWIITEADRSRTTVMLPEEY
jgi:hypothetical protein